MNSVELMKYCWNFNQKKKQECKKPENKAEIRLGVVALYKVSSMRCPKVTFR